MLENDARPEAEYSNFAAAIKEAGIYGGGTFRRMPNSDEMHVDILPGAADEADDLAVEHGLQYREAELTRRVYVPSDGE